jgi:type II secretory pathway predicted ATPase ExeA
MARPSSLALQYWGLRHWPFHGSTEAAQFYPTAGHNEALARIEHLVEARLRLGALVGESGVGKSKVLAESARQLRKQGRIVVAVDAVGVSTHEFLYQTSCGLGTTPRDDAEIGWLWRQIADRITENRMQQLSTVLFVDDAGQAGPDLVTQFLRLARVDATASARWTIVLAAESEQAARWSGSLRELVDLRIDVMPWSADDTVGYIQMALVEAERFEPAFDDRALATLHELSRGVPRQVGRLTEFALMAGAAAELELIDAATVKAAYDEVAWPSEVEAY